MSMKRLFVAINSLVFAVMMMSTAMAQQASNGFGQDGLRFGPSARPFGQPDPIFESDFLDYDAQMWAPFDIEGVDGHTHANTGFFFAHDWAYLSISRPEPQFGAAGGSGSDFHWGSHYDFGFMGESGKGLSINWLNMDGSFFINGQSPGVSNPGLNSVTFNIVEINRTFRQELSHGGFLEPYVGIRYMGLNDNFIQDTGITRFVQRAENNGFGGQVGARYVRAIGGRVNMAINGTISGVYNDQTYFSNDLTGTSAVAFAVANEFSTGGNDFVPAMDLEATFQFRVTRDISVRAGGTLIWQWSGLARVNTLPAGQNPFSVLGPGFPGALSVEDQIAAGFTFGIDWRR